MSTRVASGAPAVLDRRSAGVVLHPTSLPGDGGFGRIGAEARRFVDFLATARLGVWQVLPLGPTHEHLSPYEGLSAHAGNPVLVCPDEVAAEGWLDAAEAASARGGTTAQWIARAMVGFGRRAVAADRHSYETFLERSRAWLEDYVLFRAIRKSLGEAPWWEWPAPLRDREPGAIAAAVRDLEDDLERYRFEQFLFRRQWFALKGYAAGRDVRMMGDMPIFVGHDSAEVWSRREVFLIDAEGRLEFVSGVPPDAYSETGQRWGTPLYDWRQLAADGYAWWHERMATQLALFDLVRVDHFRGFAAFWQIPASEDTAVNGHWVQGPGVELFDELMRVHGPLPVVAEDLGVITEDVIELRRRFGFPGMKVMQFAFSGDDSNPYLPHNYEENCVVYTGTHDNDTTRGWYEALDDHERWRVREYLGSGDDMPWPVVEAALASAAKLAMVPMQDLLGLDASHRMNKPGTTTGNWRWRFAWAQVPEALAARIGELLVRYERSSRTVSSTMPASGGAVITTE